MARSTAVVLGIGAVTMVNQSVLHDRPVDWRVPIATGLAAGALALIEKVSPEVALGIAWLAAVTALVAPMGGLPSPIQTVAKEWR